MREKDKEMFTKLRKKIEVDGAYYYIQSQMLLGWETKELREIFAKAKELIDDALEKIDEIFRIHKVKLE